MSKKILVTGADGFIGSHLTEKLCNKGFNVKALTFYNSFSSIGWLEDSKYLNDIEVVSGDVRDGNLCKKILKDIDIVFNLAALIAIPYSYVSPRSYIDTNVIGTMNMCQAALDNKIERFIQISTSEVYGTAKYVPIDESHPLQAQSPYSASKIASDSVAISFQKSFDLPLILARPFNTFGPRQSARAVIPTIISQIISGKKEINLGSLSPTRDFSYVTDTCDALIMLSKNDKCLGETINIGSNQEISIDNLRGIISKLMNNNEESIKVNSEVSRIRPANSEVERLVCDNSKLKNLTGFEPRYSLKDGLSKTIEWFSNEENLSKYKPDQYNV